MHEILILILSNSFMMNKIKIIINEKSYSEVKSVSVLPSICWCECYYDLIFHY